MRSVVSGTPQHRGIALTNVAWEETPDGLRLRGLATNGGLQTASVVQINILLFDQQGAPIWVETAYLDANIYPGHAQPFDVILPHRNEITVLAEMNRDLTSFNGVGARLSDLLNAPAGAVTQLNGAACYGGMQLVTHSMDYDPLF